MINYKNKDMNNYFTDEQKNAIRDMVVAYIGRFGSLNKAANNLDKVSSATLSNITNSKYDNISDDMWRNIRNQVETGKESDPRAVFVETSVTKDLAFCMNENRHNKDFIWALSPAGSGKTVATKLACQAKNTYYILCDEDMKKSDFAIEFARAVGMRVNTQRKARTLILDVVKYLREKEDVLIIFDEGDKLSDNVLHYFITIFNNFEDLMGLQTVGIQFISTDYMATRMERGLRCKKKGYQELWSRLGAKFYEVDRNTPNDVEAICRARGVVNRKDIDMVIKEADITGCDLRRVARKINAILRKQQTQTA